MATDLSYTEIFTDAFNHAMLYECTPNWNPNDPDVIAGNISTKEQRKKVGYVNIPSDRGGETKYGIAKNANPTVNITALNLTGAMDIYNQQYWLKGKCDKLPYPLSTMHFDGCVNHGVGRACKFLQQAANTEPDGVIGPVTLALINKANQEQLVKTIWQLRTNFYNSIVARDASQKIFLNGWLRRVDEVKDFTLSKIK